MTTTGLGPTATTHTLNGTEQGTTKSTSTRGGVTVTTDTSVTDTTTNFVVPVGRGEGTAAYPHSGVRVHTVTTTTSTPSGPRTMTTRRQETFNGSNVVQIEVTVNGVTQRCTFDLAARTSTCDNR